LVQIRTIQGDCRRSAVKVMPKRKLYSKGRSHLFMRKIIRQLPLLLLILNSACSNSDVFTNPDDTVTNNTVPDATAIEFKGPDDYDLSLYFFHANTQAVGGEITFTEKFYDKSSDNELIHSQITRHLNKGTSIDSINVDNAVLLQYRITINSIKQIGVSYNGSDGALRYAELNEKFLDAVNEDLGRRDTCTLQDHLDDFDLGSATGAATIATGVYEDVLHVFCNRVLDTEDE